MILQKNQNYLINYRDLVVKHVDRISGIVQRMLSLAKNKRREHVELDLNNLIDSSLQLVDTSAIKVVKELQDLPNIAGDPGELEEVFMNIFQNAVESMSGEGKIEIKTYTQNEKIFVEVTDTGRGIPEEIREKIFDPFYSTRHAGVGLGLSIAYRIIREHGANIRVESELGRGTTFKIIF